MYEALERIFAGSREGIIDTQVEFGTLQNHDPVTIKLDLDPEPLVRITGEGNEIIWFKGRTFTELDIGNRYALIRTSSSEYLILGEVE